MARMRGENWFKNIRQWVANCEKLPDAIELRMKGPDASTPITRWILDPESGHIDDDQVNRKVADFLEACQNDANSNDALGPFTYFLVSIVDDSITERSGFIKFFNQEAEENPAEGNETPSPKGLLSQLMRHNEALMRGFTTSSARTIDSLTAMLASYQSREQSNLDKQIKLFGELEEAYSLKHERELEARKAENQEKRTDMVIGQFQQLVPALKSRLLSSGGNGVKTDVSGKAIAQTFMKFMGDLKPEQIDGLASVLGPDKITMLAELSNLLEKAAESD